MKHHPSQEYQILARGSHTSKAIYISAIMQDQDYNITDFNIKTIQTGKKEPLAVLKIILRAKDGRFNKMGRTMPRK